MSMLDVARSHLSVVPEHEHEHVEEAEGTRSFSVIDGIDRAAHWARLLGTTLLVTFVIGLVGALVVHASLIENQRALDDQRRAISGLEAETEALRHELAELEAPARIVAEARDLGMIDAPAVTYLQIPGGLLDERTIIVAENQLQTG